MKKIVMAVALVGAIGMVIPSRLALAQVNVSISVSLGGFYDELSPHGDWIECRYGECWVPRGVGAGWQPYTNGEWIYTRYGWTWVSDDPWGGSPYHYGTWAFISRYGWVWVPGTVWAPAWVTWSYNDRYIGWAPMPPTMTFGNSGYSGRAVVVSQTQYVFVPTNRFIGTNVASVRMAPGRNSEIFRETKAVTRFEVSGGIVRNVALPVATVQQAMGHAIETREIDSAKTTPRTLSSGGVGKSGNVAIVAPAREVKAVRASRQQPPPKAEPQQEKRQPQAQPQQQPQARPPQQEKREQQPPKAQPQQEKRQPQAQPQQQPQARPPQQERREQQPPKAQPQQEQRQQDHGKANPAEERGKGQDAGKKDKEKGQNR